MVTCLFRKEVNISLNPVTAIRFVLYRGLRSSFMVYHQICDWSSNYHAYTFNEAYLLDSVATMNGKNPCSNHESNFLRNRLLLFSGFVLLILFRFHCLLEAVFTFLCARCSWFERADHPLLMYRINHLLRVVMTAVHHKLAFSIYGSNYS